MIQFNKSIRHSVHGVPIAFLSIGLLVIGCAKKENDPPEGSKDRGLPNVKLKDDTNTNAEAKQPEVVPGKGKTEQPVGLVLNTDKAFKGYTLVAPTISKNTYLIDMEGKVVRTWESDCTPAFNAMLLENGHLLRSGMLPPNEVPFQSAGTGGKVQEFNWEGQLVWDFKYVNDKQLPHHCITKMPNGNVLMIVGEKKTTKEAAAIGQRPSPRVDFVADSIIEIKPTGKTTGEVVWEWRAWDHVIQDFDKTKPNYGDVSAHPELIDVNFSESITISKTATNDDLNKLKGIGYLGGPIMPGAPVQPVGPDWLHVNSVAYNAELDQIVLSVHVFSEIWVIDHSTTTTEAATHAGGKRGKGGDLLYRWGNPRAYRQGTNADRRLFGQHDAHWVPKGHPGEGNILIFNNGSSRADGSYSSVEEIVPPLDASGYKRAASSAFGPEKPVWSYSAPRKTDFFSLLFSGAQRLPNGNTLVCSGVEGTLFEVTAESDIVWKYVNPVSGVQPSHRGSKGHDGPPGSGGPKGFDGPKAGMKGGDGPKGAGAPKGPRDPLGVILPSMLRDVLSLTPEQRKQLDELQKETDKKLAMILNEAQKKQYAEIGEKHLLFGPKGNPTVGPGGPPKMPGPKDLPGHPKVGDVVNCIFTSQRYAANFPGLVGKDLTPGKPLEAFQNK